MSSDMTITEFCDEHHACHEGREWALANCATMADVWATARPDWLVWVATRRHVLSDTEMRLFAAWAARQVQHLMADPRSLAALEVAERYARGNATDEELTAAYAAAEAAAARAAYAAANGAAANAADAAAARAAYAAANGAAANAAADAAFFAAPAARAAARADARDAQATWLREHTKPNFSRRAEA